MEKWEPSCGVVGNANCFSHCGKPYGGTSKFKNRTTLQSSNCTTKCLPKECKNTNSKGYVYPDVYSNIIYNSQIVETAQVSLGDEWMKKI